MLRLTILVVLTAIAQGAPRSFFNKPGGRIVGGEDADITDYPYQLSLQYEAFHFCGAAIVSSTWAVTAGHCVIDLDDLQLTVRAGATKSSSGGQLINVTRSIIHPNFSLVTADSDIALIELEEAFSVENASPVALPGATTPIVPNATATITGWGIDDLEEETTPEILQVVKVPVISQEDCVNAYKGLYLVTDTMFCAGLLEEGGKDSCTGDSGGPVVINNELAGLVSWGGSGAVDPGCAEPFYPGVYTNVFPFVDWINENIS